MPEEETPRVQDTPAPPEPDTPDSDDEGIVNDLVGQATPTPDAPADDEGGEAKKDDEEKKEDWPESDPDGIKSRSHYLKEMQKLREREAELAEREKALEERAGQDDAQDQPQAGDDDVGPLTQFGLNLDAEDFEHESEKAIVGEVKRLEKAFKNLVQVAAHLYETQQTYVRMDQQSAKERITGQMNEAVTSIKDEFGVEVGLPEVAQALKRHGRALMEQNNGVLPDDAARSAWMMDNLALVMKKQKAESAPKGATKPEAPPITKNTTRVGTGAATDDEQILADLMAGQ